MTTTSQRTRVYFTVDTECSEERVIGGVFQPARGYDVRVWGRLRNQHEPLGIPLVAHELASAGLSATFFVEPFGSSFFGEAGLREVCTFLRERGHDLQLHLHPIQRHMDWHTRGETPPSDDMAAHGVPGQVALLREGLAILERCGVDRASVQAFRAGNFGASNDTWRAMAAVGLPLSSNFNLCYLEKNCRILWPEPANALFDTGVAAGGSRSVFELPVTNFADGRGQFRHLQVCAISFPEMRYALLQAARLGLPEVTVVTHPFEYFFTDSPVEPVGRPNPVNIERLRQLCRFLRERSDVFAVETVGALARRLLSGEAVAARSVALLPRGRRTLRYGRFAEQAYKRLAARLLL